MTLSELQQKGTQILFDSGTENAANEARWLLENDSGLTGAQLILRADETVSAAVEEKYFSHISERVSGRPLQYILGSWQFYGRDFLVGDGVLIPRPETEQLCDIALDFIKDIPSPKVIDLCAGSGCIGLTIARERPDSSVLLVEKYNDALFWLRKNKDYLGAENAAILQADILRTGELILPRADLIVTNPPYIPSSEIPGLQSEVHYEPSTALDGGEDGLVFYRAIKEISAALGNCPVIAECGENQTQGLKELFGKVKMIKDFASIERIMVYSGETNDT